MFSRVTLKSFSKITAENVASSPRARQLLVANNQMQVYRVNGRDVRDLEYKDLKDYIRKVRSTFVLHHYRVLRRGLLLSLSVARISCR